MSAFLMLLLSANWHEVDYGLKPIHEISCFSVDSCCLATAPFGGTKMFLCRCVEQMGGGGG